MKYLYEIVLNSFKLIDYVALRILSRPSSGNEHSLSTSLVKIGRLRVENNYIRQTTPIYI